MPLEDQGYCIVIAQLPAGASQPRTRAVGDEMDAVFRHTSGIKGWAMIGGYSGLDSAKISNVIYHVRGFRGLGQAAERLHPGRADA